MKRLTKKDEKLEPITSAFFYASLIMEIATIIATVIGVSIALLLN